MRNNFSWYCGGLVNLNDNAWANEYHSSFFLQTLVCYDTGTIPRESLKNGALYHIQPTHYVSVNCVCIQTVSSFQISWLCQTAWVFHSFSFMSLFHFSLQPTCFIYLFLLFALLAGPSSYYKTDGRQPWTLQSAESARSERFDSELPDSFYGCYRDSTLKEFVNYLNYSLTIYDYLRNTSGSFFFVVLGFQLFFQFNIWKKTNKIKSFLTSNWSTLTRNQRVSRSTRTFSTQRCVGNHHL